MTNPPSTERVRRLLVACRTGRLPEDLAAWLSDGLTAYVEGSGRRSLCRCLALHPDRRRERAGRNNRLRLVGYLLAPRACPWQQAEALARALDRFERAYPRIRAGHRSANGAVEAVLAAMLSDCERAGLSVPRSVRRLYGVLTAADYRRQ